jgi:hypothetical protein
MSSAILVWEWSMIKALLRDGESVVFTNMTDQEE